MWRVGRECDRFRIMDKAVKVTETLTRFYDGLSEKITAKAMET